MRSLRRSIGRSLRRAMLPIATSACVGSGTGRSATSSGAASSVTGGASGGVSTGGSTSGSGSATGTSGSEGSSGSSSAAPECPSLGLCAADCTCTTSTFVVPALSPALPAVDAGLGFCLCEEGCPQLPDGGWGPSHLNGCSGEVASSLAPDGGPLWNLTCYYATACNGGRRPSGLVEVPPRARSSLGAYFARLAHLEAASVLAFRALALQLRSLAAPGELVAGARRAARQEVGHARLTRRLAERFGGEVQPVRALPPRDVSLEELAIENRREGCVGETFGAAVACWQALHARDGEVQQVARSLWADELEHAELAWEVDAWAVARLGGSARARVDEAAESAVRSLQLIEGEDDRELVELGGLPPVTEHRALIEALQEEVWRSAPAS